MIEESHHHPFGPLLQRPTFHAHGQRAVQLKAPPGAVADHAQILGGPMAAVIQERGVLDQQILSGLTTALAGPFQVRSQHALESHIALAKEAIGRFEFGPVREGLGQGPARMGGQVGGDFH